MTLVLSWNSAETTDTTRIYRGTNTEKLDLLAEIRSEADGPPDTYIDHANLPPDTYFYAVVIGENGVYAEPAVIKVEIKPEQPKLAPATGLKISVFQDSQQIPPIPTADITADDLPSKIPDIEPTPATVQ